MPHRLPRLKRRADFVRLTRKGRHAAAPGLVLQCAPRPTAARPDSAPRIGFTASRKVGGAVVRNRARRRLRALAETILPARAKAELDYVLVARRTTASRRFAELAADLEGALGRLGALKPES